MKCIILVGGYGTRLRPLTFTVPKPLVDFAEKPIVEHQIAAAVKAGADHIILAVGHQCDETKAMLRVFEEKYKVKVTLSVEDHPLGTAGPLRLLEGILMSDSEPFFVFNSDVICEFPLSALIAFHKNHKREGTICVTQVEDPSKYGVVLYEESTGQIKSFVEKPQTFVGNKINAGLYILNKEILKRVSPLGEYCMFETVVFPSMAKDGELYCFCMKDYWADIGQPKDYLKGLKLHLDYQAKSKSPSVVSDSPKKGNFEIIHPVHIHESAQIGAGCKIGPHVSVGARAKIGDGARLKHCAILPDASVGSHSYIHLAIIGWKSKVGKWCYIDDNTVFGEDVSVSDEVAAHRAIVCPHKSLKESSVTPDKIHL